MRSAIGAMAATLALAATPALAQGGPEAREGWRVSLTPYVWLAGFSGDLVVRDRVLGDVGGTASADFADVLSSLRFAFMGAIEARRGRFGIVLDIMTLSLESDLDTPRDRAFSGGKAEFSGTQLGALALVRAVETPAFDLDVGAGLRAWWTDSSLRLDPGLRPGRSASGDTQFTDPILALRAEFRLSDRWSLRALGDVGGFGAGSQLTWQAFGAVAWRASEAVTLQAGYRHIAIDYRGDGKELDLSIGGPIVGLSWRF